MQKVIMKIFRYIRDIWHSYCYEQGWASYVHFDDGPLVRVKFSGGRFGQNGENCRADFVADPFLFRHEGVNYLFCETTGRDWKGKIAAFKETDGKWQWLGVVLEQPWHMSYPQVFEENGEIYMLPEASASNKVTLYRAVDFPMRWERVADLIDGPYADATLLRHEGHYYFACYTIPPHESAELWHSPSLLGPWSLHPQSSNISQDPRFRRCGGSFIIDAANSEPQITNPESLTTTPESLTTTPESQTTNPKPQTSNPKNASLAQNSLNIEHSSLNSTVSDLKVPNHESLTPNHQPLKIYRIAQDCDGGYGLRLYKVPILELSPTVYREGEPVLFLSEKDKPHRFKHTYNELTFDGRRLSVFDTHCPAVVPFAEVIRNICRRIVKWRKSSEEDKTFRLLYVIDDASAYGGAHIATRLLLKELIKRGVHVDVLCENFPTAVQREELKGIDFYRFFVKYHSFRWVIGGIYRRYLQRYVYPNWLLDPFGRIRRLMRKYDTVCVMSEESIFRKLVSSLPSGVRKVQMIHTNYEYWAPRHKWLTCLDSDLYASFDVIACIGKISAEGLGRMYPEYIGKVCPFYNLIDYEHLKSVVKHTIDGRAIRLISLCRMTDVGAKDGERMIRVAKRLYDSGVNFVWDVYGGDGPGLERYRNEVKMLGISSVFHVNGYDPTARSKIAKADVMVMLSHYEGLPNVIYESLIAGTPVFSTAVGGIPEQITNGMNGWLVPDEEDVIEARLEEVLMQFKPPIQFKPLLYDNMSIVNHHYHLLTGK